MQMQIHDDTLLTAAPLRAHVEALRARVTLLRENAEGHPSIAALEKAIGELNDAILAAAQPAPVGTVKQAARVLQTHPRRVRKLIASRKLRATQPGGKRTGLVVDMRSVYALRDGRAA